MVEKVRKTEDRWRQELTPEQYRITRKKGTEGGLLAQGDRRGGEDGREEAVHHETTRSSVIAGTGSASPIPPPGASEVGDA